MATGGIYRIVNLRNDKYYIGSTSNFMLRKSQHLSDLRKGKHHNRHLQFAFNKYGEVAFSFEAVESYDNPDAKLLFECEQWYLDNSPCCSDKYGYNFSGNAERPNLGRKMSAQFRLKISLAHLGKKQSPELIAKRAAAMRGKKRKPRTPEQVEAQRKRLIGHTFHRGRKHTEQSKANMSNGHKRQRKAVHQFTLDGTFIKSWDGIRQAEKALCIRHISECASGSNRTAGGFIWHYERACEHKD